MKLTIDFETRSAVTELGKTGPWPYAEHPSTGVCCLAVKVDNGEPVIWLPPHIHNAVPDASDTLPIIGDHALNTLVVTSDQIEAHNCQFEMAIWDCIMRHRYGFDGIPLHKWRDTAAVAAMHALPRSLDNACKALFLPIQKDMEGSKLMLKMCKPRAPKKAEWATLDKRFGHLPTYAWLKMAYEKAPKEKLAAMCLHAVRNWEPELAEMLLWHEDPADIVRLCQYCMQDVEAEYALGMQLGELPPQELKVFQHDLVVNTRGICVDVQMAKAALAIVATHEVNLLADLDELTSGTVRTPKQVKAGLDWLHSRGVHLDDLKAETVKKALKGDLPDDARRFLEIRQSLSKSSTAKYEAALHQTCSDGRLRGFAMYHGAGTGRWCLAEDTDVLVLDTNHKIYYRKIQEVKKSDLLWDGHEWVAHEGVVFSGVKDVIEWSGVRATREHKVYISDEVCIQLNEAKDNGLPIYRGDEWHIPYTC